MKPIQCRMARAALEWSTQELAQRAGVGANTVNRFEGGHDARVSSVEKIQAVFEAAGIEFIDGGQPGVRLKAR